MPAPATRYARFAYGALLAILGCVGAIQLFDVVLKQHVMSEFIERCITAYPATGVFVPFVSIGIGSGFVIGLAIGLLGGPRAVVIAGAAAFGVCVLHLTTAALVGGFLWAVTNPALLAAPSIATGLLLGALFGRIMRHA
jgi:hypothetical protein